MTDDLTYIKINEQIDMDNKGTFIFMKELTFYYILFLAIVSCLGLAILGFLLWKTI